jgi:hypothetical protein
MAPEERDALGLSIDMLDVDRLRTWSHNIITHGHDLTHWASAAFVAKWLWEFADRVESNVNDTGTLRQAARASDRLRVENAELRDRCNNLEQLIRAHGI